MNIAIIGAGIAGLAAAVRLRAKGHTVTVWERNSYPGGKLSSFELGGYRFDAGPSLFTLPTLVEELFAVAGVDMKGRFAYHRLETVCNYFWEDKTRLSARSDRAAFLEEIRRQLGVDPSGVGRLLDDAAFKYEATADIFIRQSLHRWRTYFSSKAFAVLWRWLRLDLFKTMDTVHQKYLPHPKLVQLFNRYATYNGSNPYQAPGILTMIPHLEYNIGAFLPVGGMHAITQSIYQLAVDMGVVFHFNQTVEEIMVKDKRAAGVRIGDQLHPFDAVVCNMDVFFAYDRLLPHQRRPERILRQPKSSSALIFYWGVQRIFPELDVHNIFFAEDYREEFGHIFDTKTLSDDPTVYINITSKQERGDAPEGGENWFVMINVPAMSGQDWDVWIPQARRRILDKLSRILGTEIAPLIAVESILEPRTIESRTLSHAGALYGTSSNNRMAAFLRHSNHSKDIQNLYFCGGSVHPGGGIPLCLSSAKIVADRL